MLSRPQANCIVLGIAPFPIYDQRDSCCVHCLFALLRIGSFPCCVCKLHCISAQFEALHRLSLPTHSGLSLSYLLPAGLSRVAAEVCGKTVWREGLRGKSGIFTRCRSHVTLNSSEAAKLTGDRQSGRVQSLHRTLHPASLLLRLSFPYGGSRPLGQQGEMCK